MNSPNKKKAMLECLRDLKNVVDAVAQSAGDDRGMFEDLMIASQAADYLHELIVYADIE